MEKKRYILFRCSEYYPAGGMQDAELSFNSIDEVGLDEYSYADYQVFDVETFKTGYGDLPLEAFKKLQIR